MENKKVTRNTTTKQPRPVQPTNKNNKAKQPLPQPEKLKEKETTTAH
jgi:hypothetical protein